MPDTDRAHLLTEAITDLTERFAHPTDLEATLNGITAAAGRLLPGVHAADVLVITDTNEYHSLAATSALARHIDRLQRHHRQGPGLDAAAGATMVLSNDLRQEHRWPRYSAAAVRAGVHATLSVPLPTPHRRTPPRAAVNLISRDPDAFDRDTQTVAAMLATHAAVAAIAHDRDAQFKAALASRDVIGQAKGMLMERFDVDAARAFALIRKLSQDSNTRVADVAAHIVARGPDQ